MDKPPPCKWGKMRTPALYAVAAGLLLGTMSLPPTHARPAGESTDSMGKMRAMMQSMMGNVLPPGISPALLPAPHSAGARLLQRYCMQCHRLPAPGMHTAGEWPRVAERMYGRMQMMNRMGMMGPVAVPTRRELNVLIHYLQKYAQRPINPAKYPDLNSRAGEAFRATCARCHALPDPTQHTAAAWPAVVARMEHNMKVMGKTVPDKRTLLEVIKFLQRHARAGATK